MLEMVGFSLEVNLSIRTVFKPLLCWCSAPSWFILVYFIIVEVKELNVHE